MIRFRTLSGSIYAVDEIAKTWLQESTDTPDHLSNLRGKSGTFDSHSGILKGESVRFICPPPYQKGASFRLIMTTPVMEILQTNPSRGMTTCST